MYAVMALNISQLAPILPSEKDKDGKVKPEFKEKSNQTCWRAHHGGDPFTGPIQPFGRLCYYHDKTRHPMEPQASPAFFVGWRIDPGCKYRGIVLVADYDKLIKGVYHSRHALRKVPEKEVHFPKKLEFPFAEARKISIHRMTEPEVDGRVQGCPPLIPLPYEVPVPVAAEASREPEPGPVQLPTPPKEFRVTQARVERFKPTPNCFACETGWTAWGHTRECRQRIHSLWQEEQSKQRAIPVPSAIAPQAEQEEEEQAWPEPHFSDKDEEEWLDLFYEGYPREPDDLPPSIPIEEAAQENLGDLSDGAVPALLLLPTVEETLPTVKRPQVPGPKEKVVYFDMTDYCRDTVRHYCKIVGKGVKLKEASTPFCARQCPEGRRRR